MGNTVIIKNTILLVISKDGTIGEILEIQNLCIALPPSPKKIQNTDNKWVQEEYPKRT